MTGEINRVKAHTMKPTFRNLTSCFVLLTFVLLSQAVDFTGKVVGVADGDTITVLTAEKEQYRVRLFGIDCPESNQPFGAAAKKFTSDQCFGKNVTIQDKGKDRYGRTIGVVVLEKNEILSLSILTNGLAWWYRAYAPKDKAYEVAESDAKNAKRGLWAEKNPVAPWDFRRGVGAETAKSPTAEKKELSHWMSASSGKRHNSKCRYYQNSKGRLCGPNDGVACKICGG